MKGEEMNGFMVPVFSLCELVMVMWYFVVSCEVCGPCKCWEVIKRGFGKVLVFSYYLGLFLLFS